MLFVMFFSLDNQKKKWLYFDLSERNNSEKKNIKEY